jgi:nicotinamidase-related amidase
VPSRELSRSALLVLDVQSSIVQRVPAGATVLGPLARALEAAREAGVAVIYVVVGFRPGYPEVSPSNRAFAGLRESNRLVQGAPGSEIPSELEPRPTDIVVTKRRVGAFSGSDLDVVLRSGSFETLVLGGIATSGVVLSTVRQAADLDYRLVVLSDACADPDPEVHRILLEKVFPRQAEVRTVAEWVCTLGPSASGAPIDSKS